MNIFCPQLSQLPEAPSLMYFETGISFQNGEIVFLKELSVMIIIMELDLGMDFWL